MQLKTPEELFYMLKELDEKVPYTRLSGIMQNDHQITQEEYDEWCFSFEKFMTQLAFTYEQTVAQAVQTKDCMDVYYNKQKQQ